MRDVLRPMLDALDGVAYMTDPDGVILACGSPGWERALMVAGSTVALPVDGVVGRNLFDLIQGDELRATYRQMMEAVAAHPGRVRAFEYRCDTPELARLMRMTISALRQADGALAGFLFQSVLADSRERVPVALFSFPPRETLPADAPFLGMCSYCQKVRFPAGSAEGEGEWIEPVDYYRRGGDDRVLISHGVCRPCFEAVSRDTRRPAAGVE